ncbi:hypothetical protein AB835_00185 [Candidatus Endobugula sertula]|uniref:Sodium:proton antiporter n=1 Tax=Candidatus Endobugula sertula TaxID=62101 RepID=A0A1D2QU54_9GAMM|nr:hypothetical protein AB835_00185 [Candidatus Endobugula sertula]
MLTIANIFSGVLLVVGCLFVFAGSVGMLRMPDLYTRIHAASLTDTGGATFIILGLLLQDIFIFENVMAGIKLVLVLVFIAFTAPTASHAIAKAALMGKLVPWSQNGQSVIEESLRSPEFLDRDEDRAAEEIKGGNINMKVKK